ncbi:tripartite tricarboxylate transporter substrate binding protein [Imbroritus primus]|uniref:tripartite tricarboxylate transporter substrate binding protein n=1 Tax=Imbroritus primus TaxID=3058603 RepID=UPI003D160D57
MIRRRAVALLLLLGSSLLTTLPVQATEYPNRPIKIIVLWPAGGAGDFLARTVGQRMSEKLSTPVLVENRPGAATNIGTQAVASADPDGYTLLLASSNNAVNVTLYPKLKFDFAKDFKPVSNLGLAPNVLVAHPSVQANTVQELVALARKQPGKLTYASSGNGSAAHLGGEKFKRAAQVEILGVPYKGAAPAVTDLLGGQVSMMFTVIPVTLAHIQTNRLKLLAVASAQRLPQFPNVPTVAESGLPGFESSIWYGIVAPTATPLAIVAKLQKVIAESLKEPAMIEKLMAQGTLPIGDTSEHFATTIANDIRGYAALIKSAGITAE